MAVLHVRNIPDDIYKQAQELAESQGTTLSSFIIELMREAATHEMERARHEKAVLRIRRNLARRPRTSASGADLVHAARKGRIRRS